MSAQRRLRPTLGLDSRNLAGRLARTWGPARCHTRPRPPCSSEKKVSRQDFPRFFSRFRVDYFKIAIHTSSSEGDIPYSEVDYHGIGDHPTRLREIFVTFSVKIDKAPIPSHQKELKLHAPAGSDIHRKEGAAALLPQVVGDLRQSDGNMFVAYQDALGNRQPGGSEVPDHFDPGRD